MKTAIKTLAALTISAALLAGPALADPIPENSATLWRSIRRKVSCGILQKKGGRTETQGKIKVEAYPNSHLYKDKEEMEALQISTGRPSQKFLLTMTA